jgi:hypothetical protein
MKRSPSYHRSICVFAFAVCWIFAGSTPSEAQSVTWQILPFYTDTDWPGSQGSPATTNGNVISLTGQPVRTLQTFSGPLRISYDVVLSARASTDGNIQFFFVPTNLPMDKIHPSFQLSMTYVNGGTDVLQAYNLLANVTDVRVWGPTPFGVSAGTVYHNIIDVTAGGNITWIINNVTNMIPSNVTIPFAQYQLELQGWQPGGPTWTVSNFAVVPEPSVAMLVAASLAGMVFLRTSKRN